MLGLFNQQPEVCNVLGDSITLRLTTEQTDGKYSVAEFATPVAWDSLPTPTPGMDLSGSRRRAQPQHQW